MSFLYMFIQFACIEQYLFNWKDTYIIKASHSKKFSSFIGPAIIPSGGFNVSSGSAQSKVFIKTTFFLYLQPMNRSTVTPFLLDYILYIGIITQLLRSNELEYHT